MDTTLWSEKVKGINHLEDVGVYGRIILKSIFEVEWIDV
jgi:hypothetical protein